MSITDRVRDALSSDHGWEREPTVKDTPVHLLANLRVNKRDGDTGELLETREVQNIITNEGADYVRTTVGSSPHTSAMRWTGIGTGSAGAGGFGSGDSQLDTEVARNQNSFNTTSNWGQFSNVTTFSDLAMTINESGLFNDDAINGGTMLAAQTFKGVVLTSDDTLEVIWKVFFSGA